MSRHKPPLLLCYHAVSPHWPSVLAVSPDRFEAQVEGVLERGYRLTTFHQAVTGTRQTKLAAVTFDDSYLSVYEHAFPVLRALQAPATIFVPTRKVDPERPMTWPGIDSWLGGKWQAELISTSWDQLRELSSAGWEIGSHTRSHPRLTSLNADLLSDELEGSRTDCEREIGRPCVSIAFPYGDFDDRVVKAAAMAGYEAGAALAVPVPLSAAEQDPLRSARVGIYRNDTPRRINGKISLLARHPRTWNSLLRARGWLGRRR